MWDLSFGVIGDWMSHMSKISPALFVLAILSFLFTFVTISCQGHDLASFTGIQLATGAKVQQPKIFGQSQEQKIAPEPYAALALLCAVIGAGLGFIGIKTAAFSALSGIAGALSLLLMRSHVNGEILTRGEGMFQVAYAPGFFLTLSLLLAATAWNAYLFWLGTRAPVTHPPKGEQSKLL